MLNLTVKTMDSQNHTFSIDDDMTVRQFKECIAERTSISVDSQRLIYFGRVLMDEKLLREYDVNGKVVHLVQRAPPSVRRNNVTRTTTAENNSPNGGGNNARGTPIFRAIDGMVLGAMAIPMNSSNNGTPQAAAPSLNPSSTLCMNRITVAKYMLECTNNIAAYLEDPSRGLNNTAMDILAQQTMESTVLEVGISAVSSDVEIPQHQMHHFVQAISSAFRQNNISNVRVLQPGGNEQTGIPSFQDIIGISIPTEIVTTSAIPNQTPPTAGGEGVIRIIPELSNDILAAAASRSEPIVATGTGGQRQQTTSTQTLAEVVQRMRSVQTRMEPFIQQYYDILLNDPTYEADNATQRETSQRVFDRVSEALHYMSHAQHAISDLMLDLSTNSPRHLCCRPILVEQSAFVSSGFAVPHSGTVTHVIRPNGNNNEITVGNNNNNNNNSANNNTAQTTAVNTEIPSAPRSQGTTVAADSQQQNQRRPSTIIQQGQFSTSRPQTPNTNNSSPTIGFGNPRRIPTFVIPTRPANSPPIQVARLIQAVMNSAPMHADVHVEINGPNMTSGPQTTTTTTNNTTDSANNELTINIHLGESNQQQQQPRVTTATHPTTSTQTRSTSRPQVHLTSLPGPQGRSLRPVPANMLSAFDRFLPCNSHHIRDNQPTEQHQQQPRVTVASVPGAPDRTPPRIPIRFFAQSPPATVPTTAGNNATVPLIPTAAQQPAVVILPENERSVDNLGGAAYNIPISIFGDEYTIRELFTSTPTNMSRMREGLMSHIQTTLFSGSTITDENMTNGLNESIEQLEIFLQPLSQFDLPDYDSRRSVENLIRDFLSDVFVLIRDDESTEFATRLLRNTSTFVKRFFTILITCVGRSNAELYLTQLVQLAITSNIFFGQEPQVMALIYGQLDHLIQDADDVREFIVIRRPATGTAAAMETDEFEDTRPMNIDEEEIVLPPVTSRDLNIPPPPLIDDDEETLPSVVVGSEPWHYNFPTSSWIPVITRDIGRQRRQNTQPPFSDAYISGMSSKRRKIISDTKTPSDVPSMISEGVRRAIQSSGINQNTTNIPIDEVTQAISTDINVQTSYKEALKTTVQERLQNDPDYNRERFPSSSKYFNNNK